MKREIEILKETNNHLFLQNINKEQEIREEVSKEMMLRSSGLLNKISELQSQLSLYENKTLGTDLLTKSVKKARKEQNDMMEIEAFHQLQEAEDEIERLKVEYEYEIQKLKYENNKLKEEIQKLKSGSTTTTTAGATKKRKNSKQKDENENANIMEPSATEMILKKSPVADSPTRSPLSPITNTSPNIVVVTATNKDANNNLKRANSPKKLILEENPMIPPPLKHSHSTNSTFHSHAKEKQSPQRLRMGNNLLNSGNAENKPISTSNNGQMANNGNGNGTYFTRLRSQLIRL